MVYFDSNVYDHISKGYGVDLPEYELLCDGVRTGALDLYLSLVNIEETASAVIADESVGLRIARVMRDLSPATVAFKWHGRLLEEAIRAYANKGPSPSPLEYDLDIPRTLDALIGAERVSDVAKVIAEEARSRKGNFKVGLKRDLPSNRSLLRKSGKRPPSIQRYVDVLGAEFIEDSLRRLKVLTKCKKRGMAGLLQLRVIRVHSSAQLGLLHGQFFGKREPQTGDSRDMQHTVIAGAADVFVTNDTRLHTLLNKFAIDNWEVIDLQHLIDRLRRNDPSLSSA